MLYKEIARVLGLYLYFLAATLCVPLVIAGYYHWIAPPEAHPQPHATLAFFLTLIVCLVMATMFRFWWGRKAAGDLYRREGLFLVVVIWFLTGAIGSLPFIFSGTLVDPFDAYFETISGLTTTGATVMTPKSYDPKTGEEIPIVQTLPGRPKIQYTFYGTVKPVVDQATGKVLFSGVEACGKAILFWRSFIQWLGGIGIVVLFLSILPAFGVGGRILYEAEVTGPVKEAMTPRIRDTASLIWKIYLGLSILQLILLMVTNLHLPLFDAVCITFSSISTGGFSIRNASIGGYQNLATETVVMVFMVLGSINFGAFAYLIKRKLSRVFEPEFNVFIIGLIIMILLVSWSLVGTPEALLTNQEAPSTFSFGRALRYGAFQLITFLSTTGFSTANYDQWPYIAQAILLVSEWMGGMSGSTAGGLKTIRYTILCRLTVNRIETVFRPQTVRALRIGPSQIDLDRATTVLVFFFIVIGIGLLGTLLLIVDGVDPETALGTIGCMQNDCGNAFRVAGPTGSFAFLSPFGTIISILWMILGRLEYFAVLMFFVPAFWKR